MYLYNEDQFFVPNRAKIFGSTSDIFTLTKCNRSIGCHRRFKISRISWSAKDYEGQRCDEMETKPNTTHCILSSIRDQVGCHVPIMDMAADGKPLCDQKDQFDSILALVNQMTLTDDETEIHKLTGCLSSCKKVRLTMGLQLVSDNFALHVISFLRMSGELTREVISLTKLG